MLFYMEKPAIVNAWPVWKIKGDEMQEMNQNNAFIFICLYIEWNPTKALQFPF